VRSAATGRGCWRHPRYGLFFCLRRYARGAASSTCSPGILLRPVQRGLGAVPGQSQASCSKGSGQTKPPPQRAEPVTTARTVLRISTAPLYEGADSLGQPRPWYGLPFCARMPSITRPPGRRLYKADPGLRPRNPGQGPHCPTSSSGTTAPPSSAAPFIPPLTNHPLHAECVRVVDGGVLP